jgi:hypothetical protein
MIAGGIVIIVINPGGLGVDGFAMAVGGGLAVLMINFLFRLGASGDREREREEDARTYFDEHGCGPTRRSTRGAGGRCRRAWSPTSRRSASAASADRKEQR